MSSTVCFRLYSDGSSMLFHCELELWPFDSKILRTHLCPIIRHWYKFGENPTNTFQDIMLTSPESAVSSILLFHRDLDLWPFDPKLWSVHLCPIVHRWRKFGENVSNTLREYRVNNISGRTHGRTHARTNRTKTVCPGHTKLGGGIK